jgi:hypothetical protein
VASARFSAVDVYPRYAWRKYRLQAIQDRVNRPAETLAGLSACQLAVAESSARKATYQYKGRRSALFLLSLISF